MRFTKKHLFFLFIIIILIYFLAAFKIPYYIYKPGSADALNPIVEVEEGYKSKGDMHLVTISGGQATPLQFIWAKILPNQEVMPLEDVRPEGVTEDEYMHAQLQMMENSQEASTVVAYKAAEKGIEIEFNGVYVVTVIDGMPADGILEMGDRIVGINDKQVKEAEDLITFVEGKKAGDIVTIKFVRDEKEMTQDIKLDAYEELDGKVGIGIRLVTDRSVTVDPEVHFSSGRIGGPSAGLMFSLEIFDQLTEEDFTRGYEIAGTGEIDYNGNVGRIGGIDKKVVAADREGADIFFAPNENGNKDSNYQVAKEKAAEIDTSMKIVPVNTFQDAVDYLKGLKPASK
ncbi:SepM family pheromone-processing serine protease [Virgibacillus halodenitrificans]|jgi:Lon-like protease|uniref:endopeptidase La n=2 Tax=Virgibacillus halodenitrificans TaxID=1482 RepID=A0AAC9J0R0_VIRHA|nr:SepM family pheromone-processing serine protease [Virgibacillus halodenitrificans]APC48735.1 hypothetical protein BME96_11290 [Virgibacillus halodenitrificans]MCJ0931312.1 PDZ domain-containing protein [Virgibacillus halodenitrificans]MEC2160193.1 SepM family pheromone-processing serine protease [Virgibacillus halodenitrificans]MYL46544.1 PDZ domain-containing protein [Virgibacillus halodenitrificans]MYL56872.1 PDZ domain-containing protein [Virgibacillus halodenitrificans]